MGKGSEFRENTNAPTTYRGIFVNERLLVFVAPLGKKEGNFSSFFERLFFVDLLLSFSKVTVVAFQ